MYQKCTHNWVVCQVCYCSFQGRINRPCPQGYGRGLFMHFEFQVSTFKSIAHSQTIADLHRILSHSADSLLPLLVETGLLGQRLHLQRRVELIHEVWNLRRYTPFLSSYLEWGRNVTSLLSWTQLSWTQFLQESHGVSSIFSNPPPNHSQNNCCLVLDLHRRRQLELWWRTTGNCAKDIRCFRQAKHLSSTCFSVSEAESETRPQSLSLRPGPRVRVWDQALGSESKTRPRGLSPRPGPGVWVRDQTHGSESETRPWGLGPRPGPGVWVWDQAPGSKTKPVLL